MALTAAYFTGELLIPSISGSTYAEVENLALLTRMIALHEPRFLKRLLGETLYAEYAAAIALNPTSGIWFDLHAQIYHDNISPAANFVYFKFWQVNSTVTSQTGEHLANNENSENVGMGAKMSRAWNLMCEMSNEIQSWLDDHATDYPKWNTEEHEVFSTINPIIW